MTRRISGTNTPLRVFGIANSINLANWLNHDAWRAVNQAKLNRAREAYVPFSIRRTVSRPSDSSCKSPIGMPPQQQGLGTDDGE